MTKSEILAWKNRALLRINQRRSGKLYGWEPLTAADAKVYERSVEQEFERLRAEHNAKVIERKRQEAVTT